MACSGKCCAVFSLNETPEQLLARGPGRPVNGRQGEAEQIAGMVRPVSLIELLERAIRFDVAPASANTLEELTPKYMCVNWDETTRLCKAYDERPLLCSMYPYGHGCDHGCDCHGRVFTPLSQANWDGDS